MTGGRKDRFYYLAKARNYRSRAAFKLLELQDKFSVISPGNRVLDIGGSPGGWSQVAHEISGETVLCIDLNRVEEDEGIRYLKGDIMSPAFQDKLSMAMREMGVEKFECIISDAMSHTSGNWSRDHASSYLICEKVMEISLPLLAPGGNVVVKQFGGDLTPKFLSHWSGKFRFSRVTSVGATRRGSSEVYIIFKGFF
ncbi:MAG: RlmE family RNA methyltransferase [Candidatus Thermoplasmatota archaeon]|nr:RlmE family RNA methyltransferase [Candidatus Thermoplasmatota archaeon]